MDLNHETGESIEGWAEVVQSISTILSTRVNTRVFRREFGSEVPAQIDAPMNDEGIMRVYGAVAAALTQWEPRFELTNVTVDPSETGQLIMTLHGNYRPQAHRGDFSIIETDTQSIRFAGDGVHSWRPVA